MNRIVFYSLLLVAVTVPSVILAAVLIESDEDQLEQLLTGIESQRLDAFLNAADYDRGGLEISAGRSLRTFDQSQRDEALALLDETTGIASARSVRLRQREVTFQDERATAVLNVEVDEGSYVALRLNLARHEGQWRLERIRVMGS